ncbi:ABC transporter permease [Paramaledivibacter caminithermalis]|jgi:peptide/nickel transport system permease protein|uniref:Peptide/nickel transport system permease protein n=1 Tax=Paramaledivibacter caminithermalis (strain DSM 15212 / CIP 107654 / DViRD3) TaxID=1121301 RepID=A0A1M6QPD4_PARC5|nr:ABC transporter permease [Paramaledivibacter caminithermalis]SHK22152.1 peptide/nickel transport system permease protein [Paramaledivibacter caminithermalis DSM 15212]
MSKNIFKISVGYVITFLFIITINFFIPRFMPGDPFTYLSSDESGMNVTYSDEEMQKYKEYYGLNKPLGIQFVNYIRNVLKGNLGYSIILNDEVSKIIISRITWTLGIVIISIIISCFFGTLLGAVSAYNRNGLIDKIIYSVFMIISEVPAFIIALIFLFYFAAYLDIFPLSGGFKPFVEYESSFENITDIIHHGVLPAVSLSFINIGNFYILSRNSMIDILQKDYIITANAKGLNKSRIILRHALRNAILPIVTRIFLSLGTAIGGAVLIENVFKYPGLGTLMREAVFFRDYPLIQGIFLIMAVMVIIMNLTADIVYKKLDPRLK